jgi:hypothetical protein
MAPQLVEECLKMRGAALTLNYHTEPIDLPRLLRSGPLRDQ